MIGSCILIAIILAVLGYIIKANFNIKKRLPPGPLSFPIVGSLPYLWFSHKQYSGETIDELAKKYGDVMSFTYGVHNAVILSSYEAMKDLLRLAELNAERYLFGSARERTYAKNYGITSSSGKEWQNTRRYSLRLLKEFGFGKKRSMDDSMRIEAQSLIQDIKDITKETNGVWNVEFERLAFYQLNILWMFVAGFKFETDSDIVRRQISMQNLIVEQFGFDCIFSQFPFAKNIPSFKRTYLQFLENVKENQNFTRMLINDVKMKRGDRIQPESFVEVIWDDVHKGIRTEDELLVMVSDFFFAGSDTTTAFIQWAILFLALYPEAQEKARQEILKHSENGSVQISLANRSNFPYMHAFILEAFRKSEFIHFPTPRKALTDITYKNFVIPKNTCVYANFYTVFNDEKFWGDPENFRPERYFEEDMITLNSEKVDRVCQFGFGPRNCPADKLALDSVFMLVVEILSKMKLSVIEGNEPIPRQSTPTLNGKPKPFSVRVSFFD